MERKLRHNVVEIDVTKFRAALKKHNMSVKEFAENMKKQHKTGSFHTIRTWINHGTAREDLFMLAIETLNTYPVIEYEYPIGWKRKKLVPQYTLEMLTK